MYCEHAQSISSGSSLRVPWWNGKSHRPNSDKAIFSPGLWNNSICHQTNYNICLSHFARANCVRCLMTKPTHAYQCMLRPNSCHTNYVCFCCDWQGLPGPIGVAGLVGPIGSMVSFFEFCLGNRKPNNLTLMLQCAIVLSRVRWGCLVQPVTLAPRVKRWVLLVGGSVLLFHFRLSRLCVVCHVG